MEWLGNLDHQATEENLEKMVVQEYKGCQGMSGQREILDLQGYLVIKVHLENKEIQEFQDLRDKEDIQDLLGRKEILERLDLWVQEDRPERLETQEPLANRVLLENQGKEDQGDLLENQAVLDLKDCQEWREDLVQWDLQVPQDLPVTLSQLPQLPCLEEKPCLVCQALKVQWVLLVPQENEELEALEDQKEEEDPRDLQEPLVVLVDKDCLVDLEAQGNLENRAVREEHIQKMT